MFMMNYTFRVLWSKDNRIRTILAMAAICIGIAISIGVIHTQKMLNTSIKNALENGKPPQITFFMRKQPSNDTINSISKHKNVLSLEIKRRMDSDIILNKDKFNISFMGIDVENSKLNVLEKVAGEWPTKANNILLDNNTTKKYNLKIGDSVVIGEKIYQISGTGTVSGAPSVYLTNFTNCYVPMKFFNKATGKTDGYQVEIALKDYSQHKTVSENVNYFKNILKDRDILQVETNEVKGFVGEEQISLLTRLLGVAGIIAFIIGIILVFQTIFTIILSRMRDYGIMRSFGYPTSVISKQIMLIGINISIFSIVGGVLLGVVLGNIVTSLLGSFLNVPVHLAIVPSSIIIGCMIGIICCAITTFIPIRFVVKEPILSSLYFFKKSIENIAFRFERFPIKWRLVLRRIFSKPLRTVLLLIFLGFASAMFIASNSFSFSCDKLQDNLFNKYYNFDFSLEFNEAQSAQRVQNELSNAIGSDNIIIEPYSTPIYVSMYKRDGSLEKTISLMGINNNSKTWSIISFITSGEMYKNSNEVLIGERLAYIGKYQIGDTISVETEDRKSYNFKIVGLVKCYENRGFYIYTMPQKLREIEVGKDDGLYKAFTLKLVNSSNIKNPKKVILETSKQISEDPILTTLGDKMDQAKNAFISFKLFVYILALLIFFAALFGLGTNINLGIWERQQEIATQIALGISTKYLVISFIRQFVLQGIVAWAISIIGGYGLGYLLVQFFDKFLTPMDYYFSYSSIFGSLLIIVVLCFLGSAITVSRLIKKIYIPLALKVQN